MSKEIAEIPTRYQKLRAKAELCRQTARKACSIWALDYWNKQAERLEVMAENLPVVNLIAEQKINSVEMWR